MESGYFKIESTHMLINAAARLKCRRAISLPDCFAIALAQRIEGAALFARTEQDLAMEMQRTSFEINIIFLENNE